MVRRIKDNWLYEPTAQALLAELGAAGHEAYFVGGCVRNALLALPVSDLDISTVALPEQVIKAAKALGLKTVPTGIEHGTVTVVGGAEPLEVTTFRKDVETDGRRATVAFADRLEDDAARRDFTMNALYADAEGVISDPTGGLADIEARRLVFVGDAPARIREDYLRIVRLYRFAAQLGFGPEGIDAAAAQASARLSYGLMQVSAERKTAEMMKLLKVEMPVPVLEKMAADGVLGRVMGGVNLPFFQRFIEREQENDDLSRLAALTFCETEADLRLSKKEQRFLDDAKRIARHGFSLEEIAYRNGAKLAVAAATLRAALIDGELPADVLSRAKHAEEVRFPIVARDLPGLQGAVLGRALKTLEAMWIESGFELSKSELLERA